MACSIQQIMKIQSILMLLKLILSTIEPNLSGPKRPQDLIPLSKMKDEFHKAVVAPQGTKDLDLTEKEFDKEAESYICKW